MRRWRRVAASVRVCSDETLSDGGIEAVGCRSRTLRAARPQGVCGCVVLGQSKAGGTFMSLASMFAPMARSLLMGSRFSISITSQWRAVQPSCGGQGKRVDEAARILVGWWPGRMRGSLWGCQWPTSVHVSILPLDKYYHSTTTGGGGGGPAVISI
jgi:hypothetical protein